MYTKAYTSHQCNGDIKFTVKQATKMNKWKKSANAMNKRNGTA